MSPFRRLLTALATLVMLSAASAQDRVVLKFATTEPPGSVATVIWQKWADQVNAEAKGAVEIQIFAGGALGRDPRNQLTLVQSGVADIAFGFPFFTPGKFPDNLVVSMPMIARTVAEGSYAIWSLYEREMLRGWDDVVPLMMGTPAPVIVMSTKPVTGLEGLKGLRSSASTPLQMQSVRAFGASPVSGFNFSNSAEAMSRGVLDMDLIGYAPSTIFKQYDVATHAFELPLGPSPMAVFMNRARFDRLSPDARAVIQRHSGRPFVKLWVDAIQAREAEVREKWRTDAKRVQSSLNEQDLARAEALVEPVIQEWAAANAPNGATLVKAFRDEVLRVRAAR